MPARRVDLPPVPTVSLAGRPLLEGWLAFTGDGRRLLVHSVDGWLQVWDVKRQALAYEYDGHFVLGAAPGPGPGRLTAIAPDHIVVLERRGRAWAAREYPHSLPTRGDDPYGPYLWVRSVAVGPEETVVATRQWVATVATADPARVLGFHPLAASAGSAEALCVRRSAHGYYVRIAYEDFGSMPLRVVEVPGDGGSYVRIGYSVDPSSDWEPGMRFVTQHADGRVIGDLTLDGRVARFCHWLHDRTATAVLPLPGRRFAAVFHGPEGARNPLPGSRHGQAAVLGDGVRARGDRRGGRPRVPLDPHRPHAHDRRRTRPRRRPRRGAPVA